MELRARALHMNASDIGVDKARYPGGVWAVVMDSSLAGGGAYTLMVLGDGTTSIYFDNGGGIIGAGEHAAVRATATHLLEVAPKYLSSTVSSASTSLPPAGSVTIHLLTFDGRRSHTASEDSLGEGRDKLSGLFLAAHEVISQVRIANEHR